jgi:hypothetical protein
MSPAGVIFGDFPITGGTAYKYHNDPFCSFYFVRRKD